MNEKYETNELKISFLKSYFCHNGLLTCNTNQDLPSLESIGGDWNSIVALIERGEVFYSKLYKGRVSYLSRDFYYQIKPYKQRINKLSVKSKEILDFVKAVELAETHEIKNVFMLSAKDFTKFMDELLKELFVTAVQRSITMNANWCSFRWGTYDRWEQLSERPEDKPDKSTVYKLLSGIMTNNQIYNLLK